MTEWKKRPFKELFLIPLRNGLTKPTRVRGSGLRMVNMKEIFGFDVINDQTPMELVPVSEKERIALLEYDDLLFARQSLVESGAGKVSIFKGTNETVFEGHLIRCRINKNIACPTFIYYLFKSPIGKGAVSTIVEQTAAAGIRGSDLANLEFSFPTLVEQEAIAAVLSSLDDKIDLLHRQNKSLESLAQALFSHLFVNGEVRDSNEVPLMEFIDFKEGPGIRHWQYVEDDDGINFINIRLIQEGEIHLESANKISREEAFGKYAHFLLKERDMIISTSGTLGRSAIVRSYHLPLCLNTSVIRFRPVDGTNYSFMYQYLQSEEFLSQLMTMASGSVQLNFGPTHLKRITMTIPPSEKLKEFADLADPLYRKINVNFHQIRTLEKLRDTLLPQLMSGEVSVQP